jgi:hypothetical protein
MPDEYQVIYMHSVLRMESGEERVTALPSPHPDYPFLSSVIYHVLFLTQGPPECGDKYYSVQYVKFDVLPVLSDLPDKRETSCPLRIPLGLVILSSKCSYFRVKGPRSMVKEWILNYSPSSHDCGT